MCFVCLTRRHGVGMHKSRKEKDSIIHLRLNGDTLATYLFDLKGIFAACMRKNCCIAVVYISYVSRKRFVRLNINLVSRGCKCRHSM